MSSATEASGKKIATGLAAKLPAKDMAALYSELANNHIDDAQAAFQQSNPQSPRHDALTLKIEELKLNTELSSIGGHTSHFTQLAKKLAEKAGGTHSDMVEFDKAGAALDNSAIDAAAKLMGDNVRAIETAVADNSYPQDVRAALTAALAAAQEAANYMGQVKDAGIKI